MEKGYITIREYAEKTDVSVQSVYKKINQANNPIKPYLKRFNNKWYIKESALTLSQNPGEAPEEKKESQTGKKLIDILQSQVEDLRKQLAEKDSQLKEKDNQISQLLSQVSESIILVNQQQKLTLLNSNATLEAPKEKGKQGFFKRVFKKEKPES